MIDGSTLKISWPSPGQETQYKRIDAVEGLSLEPYKGDSKKITPELKAEIEQELARRFAQEQDIRRELMKATAGTLSKDNLEKPENAAIAEKMSEIDRSNRQYVIDQVKAHGWLDHGRFGIKIAEAAFMIALHSGDLRLMKTAEASLSVFKGKGGPAEATYAGMADRLALIMQLPMSYGVQAAVNAQGQPIIPIGNRAKTEENRKRIGQPSLGDFVKMMAARGQTLTVLELDDNGFMPSK